MISNMRDAYCEDYQQLAPTLPGRKAPWLQRLRAEAMECFMAQGFPGERQEDWKYTRITPHVFQTPSASKVRVTATGLSRQMLNQEFNGLDTHRLVFVDGRFAPPLSAIHELPPGVTISNLGTALEQDPATLEDHLGHVANVDGSGFAQLNSAFLRDGAYIFLPSGVVLERPIQLIFLATGAPDTLATVRNLVVAEADSRATIIESYATLGEGRYLTNATTEITMARGASVEHYKLEQESSQAQHIAGIHVRQGSASHFVSHNVVTGGRLVRTDLHIGLDGEGAECRLNGLSLIGGRQHVDNHIRVDHYQPGATSRQWYKGVLDGHSRSVFSGRVVVHPQAQNTDARQTNHNLLLSDNAEADSQPQLEIYADDVQCSHGATVGQLDPEALFYLRSRAVGEAQARQLLVYAFAADILQRMELAAVRTRLQAQLTGRLLSLTEGLC
jgi:Fe-S cluster assembly protein SufD